MSVNHEHAEYTAHIARWQIYRDASDGEHAVKARGETYLPKKSTKQSNDEYDAYKQRAMYFNATGRTVDGLAGLMFRRDPDIKVPDAMTAILEDVTQDGVSFNELIKNVAEEVVRPGRAGVLVELPVADGDRHPASLAEYEREGIRPYATFYPAESIINWDTKVIGGRIVPSLVVLKEKHNEENLKDEFEKKQVDQYRVLDLDEGKYRQRVFREVVVNNLMGKDWVWVVVEEYWPTMGGKPMQYIPFEFFGPTDGRPKVQKCPIADLAVVNLSHFRTMADLENGRHWCGSPTPVFIGGFDSKDGDDVTEIRLGAENGIQMTLGSDAKYMEFSGQGLNELRMADEQKREMMAVLGSRILAPEKKQAEAAETARIHRAGEESTLASIAISVSKSARRVLEYLRDWSGASGDVSIAINTDFVPTEMTPEELTATMAAWQGGGLTKQELFERLKQGEIIRADKTFEDHETELESEGPMLGAM